MDDQKTVPAFDNREFIHGHDGRIIRVLAEFLEPKFRLEQKGIKDTVVFFGSARTLPTREAKHRQEELRHSSKASKKDLARARMTVEMGRYYDDAVALSRRLSRWLKARTDTFAICSGGAGGIMEAANKGAKLAGFPSLGLNITLPFEQHINPYISPGLSFEFYYFFLRKFWFLYSAKAIVVFPGGFGTMDEMMEVLTLVQTKKVQKDLVIVLYGKKFWDRVLHLDYLEETGMLSAADLNIFQRCDTVDEAFKAVTARLGPLIKKRKAAPADRDHEPVVLGI